MLLCLLGLDLWMIVVSYGWVLTCLNDRVLEHSFQNLLQQIRHFPSFNHRTTLCCKILQWRLFYNVCSVRHRKKSIVTRSHVGMY
jgi:hypothetical protein